MYYHTTQGWSKRSASQNREEKELLVHAGKSHGVLVYDEGRTLMIVDGLREMTPVESSGPR